MTTQEAHLFIYEQLRAGNTFRYTDGLNATLRIHNAQVGWSTIMYIHYVMTRVAPLAQWTIEASAEQS